MVEAIGYIAMILTIASFWFTKQSSIRLVNGIASVVWIWYSALIHNMPSLFVNIFVIIMHLIWFIKYKINDNTMALFKQQKELKEQIAYWEKYEGLNWLSKWSRNVRLNSLKARYKLLEIKIQKYKNKK